jgi:putative tryptophan/tyrosine transport system substrate-binding protein
MMLRREFVAGLSGAVALPFAAHGQQAGRRRLVGVLVLGTEDDPISQRAVGVVRESLAKLGWIEGSNIRFDFRFGGADPDRIRAYATGLVSLAPDVIVAFSAAATKAVQQQTRTIPIVFVNVGDPVKNGIVKSLARPEANTSGFTNLFASVLGKSVELLKDAAPRTARVALMFNPDIYVLEDYIAEIEKAAASVVSVIQAPVRNSSEIGRAIVAFAAESNGALILVPPPLALSSRQLVVRLAVQHQLPSIFPVRSFAAEGGLMSYGPDYDDLTRGASSYVDRILRGAKSTDLPVQFPTRFQLVINLRTAKAIGLTVPEAFLLRADEVIE